MVDVGLPYGNSTVLPYSQQFFIGGANSLRGFQAHSIGPGAYTLPPNLSTGTNFLPDESGDIKIEANIEYRPKLFSIVEGALFVDAGNIWLLRSNPYLPGAAFGSNFLNQIAADAGVGLRFNLTVLVLRTDVGFPILQPNHATVHFGQNGVFNLGIGYPF
jgi:outer membrane protein assembly factor BamA